MNVREEQERRVLEAIPIDKENAINADEIAERTGIPSKMVYYYMGKFKTQRLVERDVKKSKISGYPRLVFWRPKGTAEEKKKIIAVEIPTVKIPAHKPVLDMDLEELRIYQEYLDSQVRSLEEKVEKIMRIRRIEEAERKLTELGKTLSKAMAEDREVTRELTVRI